MRYDPILVEPATKEILRYVIVLVSAPIWVPFLRMLWRDFNASLREEGGLFGQPPTQLERERDPALRKPLEPQLVSEEIVTPQMRRQTTMKASTKRTSTATSQPAKPVRRSGFRS